MVREEIMGRIERELTLVMGPLAPVIIRNKAAEFGKTMEDFPESKIAELVEEISFEIHNHLKKIEFQRAALKILREDSQRLIVSEKGRPAPIRASDQGANPVSPELLRVDGLSNSRTGRLNREEKP